MKNKKKILIFGSNSDIALELKKIINKEKNLIININRSKIDFLKPVAENKIRQALKINNPDIIVIFSGVIGTNLDKFESVFRVNFMPSWELIKFYKKYPPRKKVTVIIVGSSAHKSGRKSYMLYSASKAALQNIFEGGTEYLNNTKVKIKIIHPKRVNTKMIKNLIGQDNSNGLPPMFIAMKIYKLF